MFLLRYRHMRRTTCVRRTGWVLLAVGIVCAGVAATPLALEVQWRAGMIADAVKGSMRRRTVSREEYRNFGRLPESADREDPLIARVKAFEIMGTVHAAASTAVTRAEVPPSTVMAAVVRPSKSSDTSSVLDDRIRIPGIKIDMKIVGGTDEKVLNKGMSWKLPHTSTPDQGGNTVIGCHRYLYTSGSRTCFHLDKVKKGDEIVVDWRGVRYHYAVRDIKTVKPDDISILAPTLDSVLTLFTCTPKFTSKFRLVVIADLISSLPASTPTK